MFKWKRPSISSNLPLVVRLVVLIVLVVGLGVVVVVVVGILISGN